VGRTPFKFSGTSEHRSALPRRLQLLGRRRL